MDRCPPKLVKEELEKWKKVYRALIPAGNFSDEIRYSTGPVPFTVKDCR
jgi:hypothetical protein